MRVVFTLILLACVVQAYVQRHRNYGVQHQSSPELSGALERLLQTLSQESKKEELVVFPPKVIDDVKGPIVKKILDGVVQFYPGYSGLIAFKTIEVKHGNLISHYRQVALIGICTPMRFPVTPKNCVVENVKEFVKMAIRARVHNGKLKILSIEPVIKH